MFLLTAGDSGYPLEPWLMTPLGTATTRQEMAYNSAHCKTRSVVERCFGVLKSRFRCLDKSGGTLLYSAEKVCKLVIATAVLHNYCISRQLNTVIDPAVVEHSSSIQPTTVAAPPATINVTQLRQTIVHQF